MAEALIIDAVRTPRALGKPGKGAYSGMHPQHLAATVLKALQQRNDLQTADIDDVIWGTSAQKGMQGGDMGRMAALDAGFDVRVSGVTLDRFCGSGITATSFAAAQIRSGMEDLVIAGGTEMMSLITAMSEQERAAGLKSLMMGSGNARLQARHPQSHQGVCADAIASMEGIGREALDAFSLESQKRAARALQEGRFARSLIPVVDDAGKVVLDQEEYPRPQTTAEDLAGLKPSFIQVADMPIDASGTTFRKLINSRYPDLKIEHFHHAGSSSGVVDGAAALLLASEGYARKRGLKARARIVATANVGDDPTLMLNAPVPAANKVLAKAGLSTSDIDLWEVNEAFAVVVEKFIRDLRLDREKVNVNGGAIALGHPIGATGAVLIGTVLDELERRDKKRALITMCAAGGMAPAIIIERV
ncbi:acetyl-CoA C-acyltransferase [Solimonas sp. K1W22B-7]|uniref:acetyl-CoA C-acetyltransferase n=1 Tax=Solimonas sp. K1W22B-7 TaxID=2303331 RepID=UPI000E33179E|nr:acetyl-CoA C-acetyltransferase [Solimonas sp. K1W22B-7]AXQ30719.1 acetyl-CoA C-acyltransferase [Solimonas sp. K1W22B-7]